MYVRRSGRMRRAYQRTLIACSCTVQPSSIYRGVRPMASSIPRLPAPSPAVTAAGRLSARSTNSSSDTPIICSVRSSQVLLCLQELDVPCAHRSRILTPRMPGHTSLSADCGKRPSSADSCRFVKTRMAASTLRFLVDVTAVQRPRTFRNGAPCSRRYRVPGCSWPASV